MKKSQRERWAQMNNDLLLAFLLYFLTSMLTAGLFILTGFSFWFWAGVVVSFLCFWLYAKVLD